MNEDRVNLLLDAVDALTQLRRVDTLITDDDTGEELETHTEWHPSLLHLLANGTGISRSEAGSAEVKLPIDADAIELLTQVGDLIRLWCRKLGVDYDGTDVDTMTRSIRLWYVAHTNAVRAGTVSEEVDHDVTRMVEGWVRMIEAKYAPDKKREWTEPCPAFVLSPTMTGDTKAEAAGVFNAVVRCGAKRVKVGGVERFAIVFNVTKMIAECIVCGTKWEGLEGINSLAVMGNKYAEEREQQAVQA
jgi:hypothetical protein